MSSVTWARTVFETAAGELDSYILFVERNAELLRSAGVLSFILPDTWLTLINAERFRRWVLSNHELAQLVMLNGLVFQSAVVDTMLIFLVRRNPGGDSLTKVVVALKNERISDVGDLPILSTVNQSCWLNEPQAQIKVFATPEIESFIEKLRRDTVRLDTLVEYRAG